MARCGTAGEQASRVAALSSLDMQRCAGQRPCMHATRAEPSPEGQPSHPASQRTHPTTTLPTQPHSPPAHC